MPYLVNIAIEVELDRITLIESCLIEQIKSSRVTHLNIADRLHQLIELEKLNIKDFAEQCDIPYRSMHNYVRGEREPNLEALSKINQTFNVDLNWLITGNGEIFKGISKEFFSAEENQLIEHYRMMPDLLQQAMDKAFKVISSKN